jgi:hypothetical protein
MTFADLGSGEAIFLETQKLLPACQTDSAPNWRCRL